MKCQHCSIEIKNHRKFCSMMCYKLSGTLLPPIRNVPRTEESKKRQSQTRKQRFADNTYKNHIPKQELPCKVCGKPVKGRKTCSKECRHVLYRLNGTNSLRKRRQQGENFSFRRKSRLEKTFETFLISKGLKTGYNGFLTEVYARNPQSRGGFFRLDFVIPKKKLIIEIDGKHHEKKDQKEHDTLRDTILMIRGWKTLRINYYAVNKIDILNTIYETSIK